MAECPSAPIKPIHSKLLFFKDWIETMFFLCSCRRQLKCTRVNVQKIKMLKKTAKYAYGCLHSVMGTALDVDPCLLFSGWRFIELSGFLSHLGAYRFSTISSQRRDKQGYKSIGCWIPRSKTFLNFKMLRVVQANDR